ncbi:hypothetical protein ASZ90_019862 [hydrocarbon metagenome]|uniref:Uncharacterized protein n=1 Tax=hydrocarbon metagenome TaxID=938273 RepID=A0A0W8E2E1_9ZZZZ
MKSYKLISLSLAGIFAMVGFIFLFMPNDVLNFFNYISKYLNMPLSPVQGINFFLILAVGYMYLVTLLAFFMYRYPEDRRFPLLLVNAKLASSILSFYLFFLHQPYLIYITNGIIDGSIGVLVLLIYLNMKKVSP